MDSSERLDELVARARALFESKHGSSDGCFAAFSPAKINFLGDVMEGSGGLALQITLDRWVVVFGRGKVLPEHHFPTGGKRRPPVALGSSSAPLAVVVEGEGEGEGGDGGLATRSSWSRSARQRRRNAGRAVDSLLQDLVFGRKNTSRGRSKSVHGSSPAAGGGETAGSWLKSRAAWTAGKEGRGGGGGWSSQSTPVAQYGSGYSVHGSSVHSSASASGTGTGTGIGTGGAQSSRTAARAGGGGNLDPDSNAPTPRMGTATTATSAAVPPRLSTPRGDREEYGFGAEYGSSGAPTTTGSTTTEEGFPVESGRSNSGSSVDNGSGSGRSGGSGGGGSSRVGTGGGASERRGSADSTVTDGEASSSHGGDGGAVGEGKEHGAGKDKPEGGARGEFGGVLEAAEAALAAAKAAAGGAPAGGGEGGGRGVGGGDSLETRLLPHPLLYVGSSSTDVGVGIEHSSEALSSPPSVKGDSGGGGSSSTRSRGHSLHTPAAAAQARLPPVLDQHGFGKVEGAVSFSDEPEHDLDRAAGMVHQDPAFARALAEAAQAEAEIEAAEVADIEAERQRTSRIYCEACPADGMVEFLAKRGMGGGGSSWNGLVTAVAAEYVHELPPETLIGLEAVVVSDLPGSAGDASAPGDVWACSSSGKQQVEAAAGGAAGGVAASGYGWGGAARCALLMASATFIEEVIGMKGFPRMKAMRCFSASLRCGKPPAASKDKAAAGGGSDLLDVGRSGRSGSGSSSSSSSGSSSSKQKAAVPSTAPFALEEVLRPKGSVVDAAAGAGTSESPGGMKLEDLLAIAGDDPPGALLVDSKWRTCCHLPMVGPRGVELAIVVAQPLSLETARRLQSQAEQERARGSATCRAVVGVARERHPDAHFLRDVPPETLGALASVSTGRSQQKQQAAAAAAAAASASGGGTPPATAAEGVPLHQSAGGGTGTGWSSPVLGMTPSTSSSSLSATGSQGRAFLSEGGVAGAGGGGVGGFGGRRLSPEVLAHARHLAADTQRVAEVSIALATGDMETVGRLMMQSRRSAGLSTTGPRAPRTRQEPPEPAAARLASMMSLLPGVHGSGLSDAPGTAAMGAVVALVDPTKAEGVLRAVRTRGTVVTGVAWGGFTTKAGGGSGIIRTV